MGTTDFSRHIGPRNTAIPLTLGLGRVGDLKQQRGPTGVEMVRAGDIFVQLSLQGATPACTPDSWVHPGLEHMGAPSRQDLPVAGTARKALDRGQETAPRARLMRRVLPMQPGPGDHRPHHRLVLLLQTHLVDQPGGAWSGRLSSGGTPSSTGGRAGEGDGTEGRGKARTPSSRWWLGSFGKKETQDFSGMRSPLARKYSPRSNRSPTFGLRRGRAT